MGQVCQSHHVAPTCVRSAGLIPANALQCYITTWNCCQVRPLGAPVLLEECTASRGDPSVQGRDQLIPAQPGTQAWGAVGACLAQWGSAGESPQLPWQHSLCLSCHLPLLGMAEHALARTAATWSFAMRTWLPDF